MGIIRFLLASFVVVYHCGQFKDIEVMQGPVAVQSFYIISGFYMAMILNEKYSGKKKSYQLFISNRLLRLLPVYWLVLLLTIVFSICVAIYSNGNTWAALDPVKNNIHSFRPITLLYVFLSNVLVIGQDIALYMGFDASSGSLFFTHYFAKFNPAVYQFMLVPQAWTISLELMFYLIAPFIVTRKTRVILIFILLSLLVKYLLLKYGLNYDPWTYRFFPSEMLFFLLGVAAYKIYRATIAIKINKLIMQLVAVTAIIVMLVYPYLHYYIRQYFYFIGLALSLPIIFRCTKMNKLDRQIGEFSYPVYLTHVLVKTMLLFFCGPSANLSMQVLAVSIFLSFLLNYFISSKVETFRQSRIIKV